MCIEFTSLSDRLVAFAQMFFVSVMELKPRTFEMKCLVKYNGGSIHKKCLRYRITYKYR